MQLLIQSIILTPDSRRHIISLWNPAQIKEMRLPPCYLYFQFFIEGDKLNMFVLQRSGDLFLGIPYDMALFTKILLYVATLTEYKPNLLEVQIIDAHIYDNQIEAVDKYLQQPMYVQPTYEYKLNELKLINYNHGPVITAKVAV
jgi:thymidylate synthase